MCVCAGGGDGAGEHAREDGGGDVQAPPVPLQKVGYTVPCLPSGLWIRSHFLQIRIQLFFTTKSGFKSDKSLCSKLL